MFCEEEEEEEEEEERGGRRRRRRRRRHVVEVSHCKALPFDFLFENLSVTTPETKKNFLGVGFRTQELAVPLTLCSFGASPSPRFRRIHFVFLCSSSSSNTNNASLKSLVIQIILSLSLAHSFCTTVFIYLSGRSLQERTRDRSLLSTI